MGKALLLSIALLFTLNSHALTVKVGVLAPEGTSWSKNLKKLVKEVKKETDGRVKLKIWFGGSLGDEPDVLRKIRIGQIHGGIFTGKTLGDINGDVRVLELPFTFNHNIEKGSKVLRGMSGFFNKRFNSKGFTNIGFFELGNVYFVSQKKVESIENLKGLKIWSWTGDMMVETLLTEMNLSAVPLALPDVLASLSTGVIESAYAPPMGIIALQWNTKIKYVVDFPMAYSVGAFLIGNKTWKKISPKDQAAIKKISNKYVSNVNKAIITENKDALTAMKDLGIEFLEFPKNDIKEGGAIRKRVITKLQGKLFSKEAMSLLETQMK
jgi:TRAP-type C4-dicarboxylate transport system substrate-binding protein